MDYKISRMEYILDADKMSDPEQICDILQDELKPLIENYISLDEEIKVRYKKEGNKNIFTVSIVAGRIKPFGYIPY